jgi:hypothetical protein
LLQRKEPCTDWIGGLVGARSALDVVVKRKILPCRELNMVIKPMV